MKYLKILLLFTILTPVIGFSQDYQNSVGIRGRSYNNKIMLRWAPLNPQMWEQGNTNGYKITRKTLNASNQVIGTSTFVINVAPSTSWQAYKDSSYYDFVYDAIFDATLTNKQDSLINVLKPYNFQLATVERNINQDWVSLGNITNLPLDTLSTNVLTNFLDKLKNNHTTTETRLNSLIQFLQTNNNTTFQTKIINYRSSLDDLYGKIYGFSTQSSDLDIRYAFALFSADLKYNAAKLAGLGYDDITAVSGQKYRYIIKVNTPTGLRISAPTDPIVIGQDSIDIVTNFSALPIIPKPVIKFKSVKNELSWNFEAQKDYYGSYYVERRDSGVVAYTRLTPQLISKLSKTSDSLYYLDAVSNIKKRYYYRIVGKTYFDELVYSPEESIVIRKSYRVTPLIQSLKKKTATSHEVIWKFPSDNSIFPQDSLSHYNIYVSNYSDSAYIKLNPSNLLKTATTYDIPHSILLSKVDSSRNYYFKLTAITIDGEQLSSIPYLMIPMDKTPPATPTNLVAVDVSTSQTSPICITKVSWTPNTEPDLLGYKVFRKVTGATEMIEISGGIKMAAFVNDSLNRNMSIPELTYYVIAFDKNYNQSATATIKYKKPDKRGPITPIITGYSVQGTNVNLQIQQSVDSDVKEHTILRKDINVTSTNWDIVTVIPNTDKSTSYLDNTAIGGNTYVYTIFAVDSSGNKSCFNPSTQLPEDCYQLILVSLKNIKKPVVNNFSAKLDSASNSIVLSWDYLANPELENFELYRTEDTTAVNTLTTNPSLWKLANLNDRNTIDDRFAYGKKLKYMIRAAYKDGTISDFSSVTLVIPNPTISICKGLAWILLGNFIKPTNYQLTEACEQVILEEGFGAEATDTGSIEIRTKQ